MIVWWLLGALMGAVVLVVLYRKWLTSRSAPLAAHHIMLKTADGEPLQFWFEPHAEHADNRERSVLRLGRQHPAYDQSSSTSARLSSVLAGAN